MRVVVGFQVDTELLNEIFGQDGWSVDRPLFAGPVMLYPLDADNYVMGVENYGVRRGVGFISIGNSDLSLAESFDMFFADVSRRHPTISDFELGCPRAYILL